MLKSYTTHINSQTKSQEKHLASCRTTLTACSTKSSFESQVNKTVRNTLFCQATEKLKKVIADPHKGDLENAPATANTPHHQNSVALRVKNEISFVGWDRSLTKGGKKNGLTEGGEERSSAFSLLVEGKKSQNKSAGQKQIPEYSEKQGWVALVEGKP